MTDRVDTVVIGAGIVGLAVARALARAGHEVVILEQGEAIGGGISARNSEVIHAGMYYAPGSLKAKLCVRGNHLLRAFLASHGVAHRMTGKLIVATSAEEEGKLDEILARGRANGVEGLERISAARATAMEPALSCCAALWSPATGILDTHGAMLALLGEAEAHGAVLALKSPLLSGEATGRGILLEVGGAEPCRLLARRVVNCAGLAAPRIGAAIAGVRPGSVPPAFLCKGNYFLLAGRQPFGRLVYPVPVSAGLGVHYTLDLGGQGRFGPDVEWIETEEYKVDPRRAEVFYAAIRRYWPGLPDAALQPGYAGIRPKIQGPDDPARDFVVQGAEAHGVAGLVQLYGIESPGLTSSLALAENVAALLREEGAA
ncbi:L-2-hydroxyglutarate oxidase LhgO [mine drainage metagenome]|uniref:L-2-hydroxyglutarate oxidase LhgO n=1 Tax=mine drainage metagenome TaxID=410659 RepID=A0A1J5RTE4_9ZZZZ